MSILVFVESADGKIKSTSLEAVAYGHAMGGDVTAIALGETEKSELENLGKFGAKKVLHASDSKLNQGVIQAYASVLAKAMQDENADILILANSSLGTPVAARVAAKTGASLASNVVELPDSSSGFAVKRSIYTGKAFARVELKNQKKVIGLKKNAAEIKEVGSPVQVTPYTVSLSDTDFATKILSSEKATGEVLLPEANIVVSGGRGMKGPEQWHVLDWCLTRSVELLQKPKEGLQGIYYLFDKASEECDDHPGLMLSLIGYWSDIRRPPKPFPVKPEEKKLLFPQHENISSVEIFSLDQMFEKFTLEAIFKKEITKSTSTRDITNLLGTVFIGSIVTAHLNQLSPLKIFFRRNLDHVLKGLQ